MSAGHGTSRLRFLLRAVDERAGHRDLPLLSVSQYHGVVPRAQLTPDERRTVDFSLYKVCKPGDIVVNRMSAYQGALGRSRYLGIVSPDYIVMRPAVPLDSRWLHHLMRSSWFVSEMAARVRGIGSIGTGNVRTPRVSAEEIGDIRANVPSPARQRAIADFLDTETARIDALIGKKRRMTELLRERLRSASAGWRADLDARFGVVPLRHWITTIEQGWSPVCDSSPAQPDEWGVLKTSAVSSGVFKPDENKRLPPKVEPDVRWAVAEGDLLVTRGSGSSGSVAVACVAHPGRRRLTISDLIYRVRLTTGDPAFVASCLRSPQARSEIESSIRTDAGQTLKVRADDLRSLTVPNAPQSEQHQAMREWAENASCLTRAITLLDRQIGLLGEHGQALISAAVIGELGTPGQGA